MLSQALNISVHPVKINRCQNKLNIKELITQPFDIDAVNPLLQWFHLKRPPGLFIHAKKSVERNERLTLFYV